MRMDVFRRMGFEKDRVKRQKPFFFAKCSISVPGFAQQRTEWGCKL